MHNSPLLKGIRLSMKLNKFSMHRNKVIIFSVSKCKANVSQKLLNSISTSESLQKSKPCSSDKPVCSTRQVKTPSPAMPQGRKPYHKSAAHSFFSEPSDRSFFSEPEVPFMSSSSFSY